MMRAMHAIHDKEWRIALDTPLGYVVATAFLLASGFLFGKNLFLYGQADMRAYLGVLPMLLMFFTPALTMRLLADERHDGTFELLATMPVRTSAIVLGKFLAAWGQVGAWLGASLVFPLSLELLADLDWGQVAAGYLAAALLAGVYIAIGLFASATSGRGIVAYVVGFGLLLALFLLHAASSVLPVAWQDVLSWLHPLAHFDRMLRGVVALDDLVLPLVWIGYFLLMTVFQLDRRLWQ